VIIPAFKKIEVIHQICMQNKILGQIYSKKIMIFLTVSSFFGFKES